jgi:hypothetical protein
VLLAVDVNHDYKAAPSVGSQRYAPLQMGKVRALCTEYWLRRSTQAG